MDKARRAAVDAEQMLPSKVAPLALAVIYENLGEREKARGNYEKALERQPENPSLVRLLAEFYLRNGQSDRAAPLVEKLLKPEFAASEADRVSARRMKAIMLIAQRKYSKLKQALALIEENLKSPLTTRKDLSVKARALAADPATARSADTLKLMEDLVRTGGVEPDPGDRYALANLYYQTKKWPECREQMEKLVSPQQCDPAYVAAYIKMLLDQDQLVDAALWLTRLEKVGKPGSAVPLRAEWMFRRKTWGEIKQFLNAYLQQPRAVPEDRSQRRTLVAQLFEDFGKRLTAPTEREVAKGFFDEAARLLEENAKDNPSGQMRLASFYARRGRFDEAIKLLKQHADKADSVELAIAAVAVINSEKITPDQLKQLDEILTAASAARKEPVILLTALGVLKIVQEQPKQAEAYYRKVIDIDPDNFRAYNNLAILLALKDETKTDEALTLIDRAIELAGALPSLIDSRAVVRIKRGEPQRALEDLETILGDTSDKVDPAWLFHKAWALSANSKDDARDVLANARKEPYNLDSSKIDAPERREYDKLIEDLKE
jgi:tetratricopeptide (TPR) repeat protein